MKEKLVFKKKVQTIMRDGTKLVADLYLPNTNGPFPTIVERVPIFKERNITSHLFDYLAKKGFAIIAQDSASRWHKEGVIRPFFSSDWTDSEDGYDTIEWVAKQPWCNGKVGAFGYSYASWTAWVLAAQKPPHLVALFCGGMVPKTTDWQMGGIFRIGRQLQSTLGPMATYTQKIFERPFGPSNIEKYWHQKDCINKDKWLWYLPIKELPLEMIGGLRQRFHDWLDNIHEDRWHLDDNFEKINLPIFHLTSWYDRLSRTVYMFRGMRERGATKEARRNQRMIIGPWSHMDWAESKSKKNSDGCILPGKVGEIDFGHEAQLNLSELVSQWFEYWLMGKENIIMNNPPIRLFTMGANSWRDEEDWPIKRAKLTDFYLHSKGDANTPFGNGCLDNQPPATEIPDKYLYDPRNPVMTFYNANYQDEPHDQRALDHRRDVLVYQTDFLRRPIEVTGEPLLILYASSSAPDTDFTVKLIDVWPDGFSQDLCYGIIRARFRDGFQNPEIMKNGEIYEFRIKLLPTSNLFKTGHKIRVDISSSDFPNFNRNHNTGGDDYGESNLVIAQQTIYHETKYQSRIQLPVIP